VPLFSPPTYEEGINTRQSPLRYFRITKASSVVRRDGVLVTVRTPFTDDLVGTEGVDWFLGGHEYNVSDATFIELGAGGFLSDTGYGQGLYGVGAYGA